MTILFDRKRLQIKSLLDRAHDLDISAIMPLEVTPLVQSEIMQAVARDIVRARTSQGASILFIGAHVIRAGVQRYLIDLMERGYISCLAMNGAGVIHDYEFALIEATTESVARYIADGQFGLWQETAYLNDIVNEAYASDRLIGMGESIGRFIENSTMPGKSFSLLAAAYRLGIPATVHVAIGQDIIHEHPNFDGAATGALSYNDFLALASVMENLEHGVVMNFGSAVMAPEVYLKALSMARNVARQQGGEIRHFTTLVCDLLDLPANIRSEPPKESPAYYFRPFKTMLVRTVADGGKSYYQRGRHRETIPLLWNHIMRLEGDSGSFL
jgi:hypothetical protein